MTLSPRLERSRSASASIAVGLAVGWSLRPRRTAQGQDFWPEVCRANALSLRPPQDYRRAVVILTPLVNSPFRSTEERLGDGGRQPKRGGHLRKTLARPRVPARNAPRFSPQGSWPLANLDLGPSLRRDARHCARPVGLGLERGETIAIVGRQSAAALLVDNRGANDRRNSGARLCRRRGGGNRRRARPFRGRDHRRPGSGAGRQDPLRARPAAKARASPLRRAARLERL